MKISICALALLLGANVTAIDPSLAQEVGTLQSYGTDGRLFSTGEIDYFLLSRQSYGTEDSIGYTGQIRIVKKYAGDGFEIQMRDYTARCTSYDENIYVMWSEAGKGDSGEGRMVDIKTPNRLARPAVKDSYNLYWAACKGQFRKFK